MAAEARLAGYASNHRFIIATTFFSPKDRVKSGKPPRRYKGKKATARSVQQVTTWGLLHQPQGCYTEYILPGRLKDLTWSKSPSWY